MEAPVRLAQRSCAPKFFPCPQCGTPGQRRATHTRHVRDIAFGEIVFIALTVGEYRARCQCCKTFRSRVDEIEPRAEYTNRVRDAVIDRLLEDGMSLHRLQQSLKRDFLLDLSDGFLHDCLDWKVRQTDMPSYRQWTLERFSGTLCPTNSTWGTARCSWPRTRSAISPSRSLWFRPTIRITWGGS